MINHRKITPAMALLPLVLAGCVMPADSLLYSSPTAGFENVSSTISAVSRKDAVWVQSQEQAEALSERVHGLVHNRTISADTAVQVALINNKGLQAAYTELGQSAVEAWQQTLYKNPKVSVGVVGIGAPEVGIARSIEGFITTNILALLTKKGPD